MNRRSVMALALGLAALACAPVASVAVTADSRGSAQAATVLTREKFLAGISADLAAHFNLQGNLEVELLRPWSAPSQLASTWIVTVVEFPNVATSSMMIRCRIMADATVVAEPTLVVRAALWRDAWSTRLPLTVGSTFDPAVLETRRIDLFRERDALPASVGDGSYVFARGVAPGRLLTWRDIARRPLVRKGEAVNVSATDGALVVTMKAVAMENGAEGDTVTVRNPDSRKDFAGLVTDENRVEVRF